MGYRVSANQNRAKRRRVANVSEFQLSLWKEISNSGAVIKEARTRSPRCLSNLDSYSLRREVKNTRRMVEGRRIDQRNYASPHKLASQALWQPAPTTALVAEAEYLGMENLGKNLQ